MSSVLYFVGWVLLNHANFAWRSGGSMNFTAIPVELFSTYVNHLDICYLIVIERHFELFVLLNLKINGTLHFNAFLCNKSIHV